MKQVITWSAPTSGEAIALCRECEERFHAAGQWPRDWGGREYCQVQMGLHEGTCHACELGEVELPAAD